jgi:hypothetical protein
MEIAAVTCVGVQYLTTFPCGEYTVGYLAEFLRETITRWDADRPAKEKIREEWVQTVARLIEELKGWVEESNVENLLTCRTFEGWVGEEGLGRYKAPGLIVELDGEQVFISARGRNVLGFIRESPAGPEVRAEGRVDVTNNRITFSLLRASTSDSHEWYVYDDLTGLSKPLTQNTFEAILVSLLK